MRATLLPVIDPPWTTMEPIRLGKVPTGLGIADLFLVVESNEGPVLRVDLYVSSEESYFYTDACVWSDFGVVGWGHYIYLIEIKTRSVTACHLESYFGYLYPKGQYLIVASAECLFRIEPNGAILWRSKMLGIDGVVVAKVQDGIIHGEGERDPPGGWQPFKLSLTNGQEV